MLYVRKTDDYLKILTDYEVENFVVINFNKNFKSAREEQNLRKVSKLLYISLNTPDEVEKYVQLHYSDNCTHYYNVEILNLFYPELQSINTKLEIKIN